MGVSALHSWHGVLGNVFPWKMGLWGDRLITKSNEDGERRLLSLKTMAAIFLQKDAQEPLKNNYITAMVGPTQRSI
jgi:hypothetical protein